METTNAETVHPTYRNARITRWFVMLASATALFLLMMAWPYALGALAVTPAAIGAAMFLGAVVQLAGQELRSATLDGDTLDWRTVLRHEKRMLSEVTTVTTGRVGNMHVLKFTDGGARLFHAPGFGPFLEDVRVAAPHVQLRVRSWLPIGV